MNFPRSITLLWALASAVAAPLLERDRLPTSDELADAKAWFDGLTVPNVAGQPYVEVVTQRYPGTGGKLHERKQRGFLLAEDNDTWTLVPDGTAPDRRAWDGPRRHEKLWPLRVPKPRAPRAPGASPDRRDLDVGEVAAAVCAEVERPRGANEPVYSRSIRGGGHAGIFLLARFCARAGHRDAAAKLDRAVLALPLTIEHSRTRERIPALRTVVEQEIGWLLLRRALTAFGDEAVPRTELLAPLEQLAREFPGMEEIDRVREHAATLRRMLADDASPPRDPASLPPPEREWVFRLRDQTEQKHGGFMSGAKISVLEPKPHAPGGPDHARDDRRPAQRLLNLGHAAVPSLIEALSDTRFTRAIQTSNMQPSLPRVLTVADCAEEILERISGRAFWLERVQGPNRDSTPANSKGAVEKWWSEVWERGEPAVMAEAVRRGDQSSMEQARRLAQLDPAAAAAVLPEGIRRAQTGWIRETLVGELAGVGGEGARPVLMEEMTSGRWLQSRVAAAHALQRLGDATALPAMIEEWRRWTPAPGGERDGERDTPEPLVRFLLKAERVEAVRALEERFASLHVTTRVLILESIQREPLAAREGDSHVRAARLATERFLLRALDDREVDPAMSYGGADRPSWKARVCDHAASALQTVRGEQRVGPGEASLATRNALIERLKRVPRR